MNKLNFEDKTVIACLILVSLGAVLIFISQANASDWIDPGMMQQQQQPTAYQQYIQSMQLGMQGSQMFYNNMVNYRQQAEQSAIVNQELERRKIDIKNEDKVKRLAQARSNLVDCLKNIELYENKRDIAKKQGNWKAQEHWELMVNREYERYSNILGLITVLSQ